MNKLFIAAIMLLAPAAVFAQAAAPAGSSDSGYKVFMKYQCYTCHGTIGQGGGAAGPRIAPNPFPWPVFENQVRKPRLDMPPYREGFVNNQELADIYAYLMTIKPAPPVKEIPQLDFSENTRATK